MYWSRGLFLWMVQRTSQFRNLKQVDGTTQEFVSGTFRGCKFQFCLLAKYFISVNSGSCSHTNFHQTVMNWYVLAMPWIILGEKQLIFQVWEVANHWNDRVKSCMKKLGSLPSRTDEISLLYVSPMPKIKLLNKNGTKFPSLVPTGTLNWNTSEVFCCRSIQHDTLPHRQMSTSRIEILKGISNFSILLREDDEVPKNAHWFEN